MPVHSIAALKETKSFGDSGCCVRCPHMHFIAFISYKTDTVFYFEDKLETQNKKHFILKLINEFCQKLSTTRGKHK